MAGKTANRGLAKRFKERPEGIKEADNRVADETIRRSHGELERRVAERTAELLEANAKLKREIRERKRVEKALREQTLRNELILETAMDGFHMVDMDGKIIKANHSASEISGYSQEEMIGLNLFELGTRETQSETAEHIKTLSKKGSHRFETRHRHKKGQLIELEVSTNFVKMGKEKFLFSFFHDITKRKREERARN
ncbi:PAS domain S-box protein [Thermodesulfobacteriota bacterium]